MEHASRILFSLPPSTDRKHQVMPIPYEKQQWDEGMSNWKLDQDDDDLSWKFKGRRWRISKVSNSEERHDQGIWISGARHRGEL